MDFSGCLNEGAIEPAVVGCRGDFDFTIKFEKIFFSLIPSTSVLYLMIVSITSGAACAHPAVADCSSLRVLRDLPCSGVERPSWVASYSAP